MKPSRTLAAHGPLTWLGNFGLSPEQLPGPLVLRIFPSKFPEVALAAPVHGSWSKELTFRRQQVPYTSFPDSSVGKESTFNAGDPG